MIREEKPFVISDGPLRAFCEQLADWIASAEGREMYRVAGVYGGRGTGKTSVLMTVLDLLQQRNRDDEDAHGPGAPVRFVLPHPGDAASLFAPSETRDSDDLLFLLLDYLENQYTREGSPQTPSQPLQQAREAEVRRKDIERFLSYERDVSPSVRELPARLIRIHSEVAGTTAKLREHCRDFIDTIRRDEQTLVIPIDDLDLQPHRALELLELLALLFNWPGVTVLVSADRPLLLHSIRTNLQGRKQTSVDGLTAALLAKYVPHPHLLPRPSNAECMDILWREETPDEDREETTSRPLSQRYDNRPQATNELGPLLPRTYRGLKALHNLLDNSASFVDETHELSMLAEFTGQQMERATAMAAALDVQYPHTDILSWLYDEDSPLREVFDQFTRSDNDEAQENAVDQSDDEDGDDGLPEPINRLLGPPYIDEIERIRATRLFRHFLETLDAFRREQPAVTPEARFLAVSLNADAMTLAASEWRGTFDRDDVSAWHIDLRHLASDISDVRPEEIRAAREYATDALQERGIAAYPSPIWIHLKARLSFALWLGWALRMRNRDLVYNYFEGRFTPFEVPSQRIGFLDRNRYQILEPEPRLSRADQFAEAVVLIDLLGYTTSASLNEFADIDVPAAQRFHLSAPHGTLIDPGNAFDLLEDCMECLGHLRRYNRVTHFHLAVAGSDTMTFLLGRELNAMGRFTVYDRYSTPSASYLPVFDIDTHG